jgi:hypothetical protein
VKSTHLGGIVVLVEDGEVVEVPGGEVASLRVLCGAANFRLVRADGVRSLHSNHGRAQGFW